MEKTEEEVKDDLSHLEVGCAEYAEAVFMAVSVYDVVLDLNSTVDLSDGEPWEEEWEDESGPDGDDAPAEEDDAPAKEEEMSGPDDWSGPTFSESSASGPNDSRNSVEGLN